MNSPSVDQTIDPRIAASPDLLRDHRDPRARRRRGLALQRLPHGRGTSAASFNTCWRRMLAALDMRRAGLKTNLFFSLLGPRSDRCEGLLLAVVRNCFSTTHLDCPYSCATQDATEFIYNKENLYQGFAIGLPPAAFPQTGRPAPAASDVDRVLQTRASLNSCMARSMAPTIGRKEWWLWGIVCHWFAGRVQGEGLLRGKTWGDDGWQ